MSNWCYSFISPDLITICYIVTFSLSQASNVVVVLAQLDKQYFRGVDPFTSFGLEFVIYRQNETDALATSLPHSSWYRSVNVELNLDAGEYVVQVAEPPFYESISMTRNLF